MSNRTKRHKSGLSTSSPNETVASRHGSAACIGLASLPAELLLEIVSYLPRILVPIPKTEPIPFPTCKSGLERVNFLRVLSQTCHSLRSFALPLAWESIEVCASDSVQRRCWERELATELIEQLEIVTIRDPTLAKYVKIVNVAITKYSMKSVVEELARCLGLFPNLEAIQILGDGDLVPDKAVRVYHQAFWGKKFPTVRTLVFGLNSSTLIQCCPNAKFIQCTGYGMKRLQEVYLYCPGVKELRSFEFHYYSEYEMDRFVKSLPDLEVFNFNEPEHLTIHTVQPFEKLKDLRVLCCIRVFFFPDKSFYGPGMRSQIPEMFADILKGTAAPGPGSHKCVIAMVKESATNNERRHIVVSGECPSKWDCRFFRETIWPDN